MGTYRVAQVCPNGHVATEAADQHPEQREAFCSKCGEATITQCPKCNASIRGHYYVGVFSNNTYEPPAFCYNCGSAFPWTERKIAGAVELVQAGADLSPGELEKFKADLTEVTKDSPKTKAASLRLRKMMDKIGRPVASAVRDIVVDVVSEAVRKTIWGA